MINQSIKSKNNKSFILKEAEVKDVAKLLKYIGKVACESDFLTFGEGEFKMSLEDEEGFILWEHQ